MSKRRKNAAIVDSSAERGTLDRTNKHWINGTGARDAAAVMLLALLTLVPYVQTAWFDFVNFDDPLYVYDNELIKNGLNWNAVKESVFEFRAANWHPLVWISYMVEIEIFGMNSGVMHVTNVILHLLNSLLLFAWLRVSRQDTVRSFLAGVLFAVHPAHVESVAWVTERKDVLSTFFLFLSLIGYSKYVERSSKFWYAFSVSAFAIGLTAKSMLVTLPVLLILIDVWPLDRIKLNQVTSNWRSLIRLIPEKLPFVLLSGVLCAVTIAAQKSGGAVSSLTALPLQERISNAAVSYVRYCWMSVWPFQLSVFYPMPETDWGAGVFLLSLAFLTAVTGFCFRRRSVQPAILIGWLWFLFTLLPVIGLVQVGMQSIADRYTYISMIGLSLMLLWGLPDRCFHLSPRQLSIIGGITFGLVIQCTLQTSIWKNNFSLFESSLAAVPKRNIVAFQNLVVALNKNKRHEEALETMEPRISEYKSDPFLWLNMGNAHRGLGRDREAVECYQMSVQLKGDSSEALNNLGLMLCRSQDLNDVAEGMQYIRRSLEVDPSNAHAHNSLGNALVRTGKFHEAAESYREAIRLGNLEGAKQNLRYVEAEILKLKK
jgi:hypothetical protein